MGIRLGREGFIRTGQPLIHTAQHFIPGRFAPLAAVSAERVRLADCSAPSPSYLLCLSQAPNAVLVLYLLPPSHTHTCCMSRAPRTVHSCSSTPRSTPAAAAASREGLTAEEGRAGSGFRPSMPDPLPPASCCDRAALRRAMMAGRPGAEGGRPRLAQTSLMKLRCSLSVTYTWRGRRV